MEVCTYSGDLVLITKKTNTKREKKTGFSLNIDHSYVHMLHLSVFLKYHQLFLLPYQKSINLAISLKL